MKHDRITEDVKVGLDYARHFGFFQKAILQSNEKTNIKTAVFKIEGTAPLIVNNFSAWAWMYYRRGCGCGCIRIG